MYSTNYIKNLLSFSALCFFAPFVHFFLSNKDFWLDQESKDFVKTYIKLWYFNIFYIILIILFYILNLFFPFTIFEYIYQYGIIPLLILLVLQIIFLLEWKEIKIISIFNPSKRQWDLFDIIRAYLPWYNYYIKLSKPNWDSWDSKLYFLKEALFLRTIFVLSVIFLPAIISKIIFLLILFRIISLVVGFDLFSITLKQKINWLFANNVEELRGTLVGSVFFIFDVFKKKVNKDAMPTYLKYAKDKYSNYYTKEIKEVFWEYIILIIIIVLRILSDFYYNHWYLFFDFYKYLAIIILLTKCILSLKYNTLTLIPWIHEIVHYIKKIILYFYNKILWQD